MGTYDTFIDPSKGEEHQSKAFGQGMQTYRPGDAVSPQRAPLSEADYDAYDAGSFNPTIPGLENTTLQAQAVYSRPECYINIVGGVYTGISDNRDMDVPLIDSYGRVIEGSRSRS